MPKGVYIRRMEEYKKRKPVTEEARRNISKSHRDYQSEGAKQKIGKASKETWEKSKKTGEYKQRCENISKSKTGKKRSEEAKKSISKGHLGQKSWNSGLTKETNESLRRFSEDRKREGNPMFGKSSWNIGLTKETDSRIKNMEENEDRIEKIKDRWKNPEFKNRAIKAILQGLMKRPTSFEKKIADLCIENSLPFIYTGDGQFLINFKNPDFVNHQDKVVIEVFYSWFKIRSYGSVENYKEFCKKKYNPAGWKVIFIDENEVNVENWKELCLNKILYSEHV